MGRKWSFPCGKCSLSQTVKFDMWDSQIYISVFHLKNKVIQLQMTLLVILFAMLCSTPCPVFFDM
jgi:hypothetical protein